MGFQVEQSGKSATTASKGLPWLKADDLTVDKIRFIILWAGDPARVGNRQEWAKVSLKIELQNVTKTRRIWTLGDTNPCFDELLGNLGRDAETWKGREGLLWLEVDDVTENKFIRCEVIAQEAGRKKGASAS